MVEKINQLMAEVEAFDSKNPAEIEEFRIKVLSKKGLLNQLMEEFKTVPAEQKREMGQKINQLKNFAQERITTLKTEAEAGAADAASLIGDMTRPGTAEQLGSRHPISLVRNQICDIFSRLGYTVADGPEIEDDWHVFSSLNFPMEHPARDMQDTFFIEKNSDEPNQKDVLLRTHTSSIQVRTMEHQRPPIRVVCPGRVFRNEAIS
jgi:phenylalanyl-tRNA synthetase alpha chain